MKPFITDMRASLLCLLIGRTAAQFPTSTCWSDLSALAANLQAANVLDQKIYTLCPNTVFDIGFRGPTGQCCTDGQNPLEATSNTLFRCGFDGKSSNNCVLRGGDVQFQSNSFSGFDATKVQVVGITFEAAINTGIRLANAGDVTFSDCIFRGHANLAPITIAYTSTSTVNRQRVIFDDCLFEENRQGSSAFGADQFGVVTIVSSASDVVIRNSIFRENIFADALANTGYAVANYLAGSTLTLDDTCFIDNDFIGGGPVLSFQGNVVSSNRCSGTFDRDVQCQFMSVAPGSLSSPQEKTCIGYQQDVCLLADGISRLASESPSTAPSATTSVGSSTAPSSTDPQSNAPTATPPTLPVDMPMPAAPTLTPALALTQVPTSSPVQARGPAQATGVTGAATSRASGPWLASLATAMTVTTLCLVTVSIGM